MEKKILTFFMAFLLIIPFISAYSFVSATMALVPNVSLPVAPIEIQPIEIEPVEVEPVDLPEQQTTCGTLYQSVNLTNDLVSQETCFKIEADNIMVDCQGHSITGTHVTVKPYCSGNNSCEQWNHNSRQCMTNGCTWVTFQDPNPNMTYGIYSDGFNNIEIRNCIISNFTAAINLRNSDYSRITDNYLQDNADQGIWLRNNYGAIVSGNNVDRNGFSYFLDWGNLTFPIPSKFSGIYLDYMLEPDEQRPTNSNTISENNLTDNSQNGIILDEGLKYNLIEHNTILRSGENMGDGIRVYSNSNQISNNNASYGYYAGIALMTSSYNRVYGNTAYHNNYTGLLIEDSSHYNEVYSNIIEYNGCEGVYINRRVGGGEDTASTYNRVYNNDIRNNTLNNEIAGGGCLLHFGVLVDISPYNYLYYNNITDNGVGISPDLSHHQYYFNNTIGSARASSMGIFFQVYSKESVVSFNRIYGISCINISYSHDNISIENNELDCNTGITITGFGPYENISVSGNRMTGQKGFMTLASYNSREFSLNDNVIENTIPLDIYALTNDTYRFVNDTYDKSLPELSTAGCSFPVASREWFFRVHVRDNNGTVLQNATVNITSLGGDYYKYQTDSNGSTPLLELPEYQRVMNWSQDCVTYNILMNTFSPYTVNVSKSGYRSSSRVIDLNASQEILVTLDLLRRQYAAAVD